ncbi:CLUMA_CG006776, isoform A [Clunio marinus]|uniref:CLUMA_CG006776, isoform A n=1 Tax=Clunio marinus TaxID=568069 RepID=A0A1J1HYQ0_9DIPT|nr:CLUMA_CG006776, isoform A [Clunio marinus]
MNHFQSYQSVNKYPSGYQYPSAPEVVNPFGIDDQIPFNDNVYGLKYGMTGPSAMEAPNYHGHAATWPKEGKLKGAAVSALTLLAFLFFLNLLQSCLKEHLETVSPTVMVMSAGQRGIVVSRNDDVENDEIQNDEIPRPYNKLGNVDLEDDIYYDENNSKMPWESDEYLSYPYSIHAIPKTTSTTTTPTSRRRKKKLLITKIGNEREKALKFCTA